MTLAPLVHRERILVDDGPTAWWTRGPARFAYSRWAAEHQRRVLRGPLTTEEDEAAYRTATALRRAAGLPVVERRSAPEPDAVQRLQRLMDRLRGVRREG